MASRTIVDLARALCPEDGALHGLVDLAVRDPAGFLAAHPMRSRGVRAPVPNLAVLALIDALIERGLATELDWKEDPPDVIEQVFGLRSLPSRLAVDDADEPELDEDMECFDALALAHAALRPRGVLVLTIDIQSDSYPTVLVDADVHASVEAIARECNVELLVPGA